MGALSIAAVGVEALNANSWILDTVAFYLNGKLPEKVLVDKASGHLPGLGSEIGAEERGLLSRTCLDVDTPAGTFRLAYGFLREYMDRMGNLGKPTSNQFLSQDGNSLIQRFERGNLVMDSEGSFRCTKTRRQLFLTPSKEPIKPADLSVVDKPVRVPSFLFHDVVDRASRYAVTGDCFLNFVDDLLASGVNLVSLEDIYAHFAMKKPLPERSGIIRIDDGLKSVATTILPIMETMRNKYPNQSVSMDLFIPEGTIGESGRMDKNDLEAVSQSGLARFGYHGVDERLFTEYERKSFGQVVKESKARLKGVLGRSLWMVAYPGGRHDPAIIDGLAQAGFILGASTQGLDLEAEVFEQKPAEVWSLAAKEVRQL